MNIQRFFQLLTRYAVVTAFIKLAAANNEVSCNGSWMQIRHIEGQGVGYNRGYTALETFFTKTDETIGHFTPFLDLQGLFFDNGRIGTNMGIGLRRFDTTIVGGHIYYDYRKTNHSHYNQISVGIEALSEHFEYRLDSYAPFGHTKSGLYDPSFVSFAENQMNITTKQEIALPGINTEVAWKTSRMKNLQVTGAVGLYYFGKSHQHAFGGQTRLALSLFNHVFAEASLSYDSLYRLNGQGQLALRFAFGAQDKGSRCYQSYASRLAQPVERFEVIPVTDLSINTVAVNADTGAPFFFYFVDNTASGNGTYESPFSSLHEAEDNSSPNQVVYVFEGDGTESDMATGFVLQEGQRLLGSGSNLPLSTTYGTLTIPQQTSGRPHISGNALLGETTVVTLANNSEVSGFIIESSPNGELSYLSRPNSAILGEGVSSYTVSENEITLVGGSVGIYSNVLGTISITNNTFLGDDDDSRTYGIYMNQLSNGTVLIADNEFSGTSSVKGLSTGIFINSAQYVSSQPSTTNFTIQNNLFSSTTNSSAFSRGIYLIDSGGPATVNAQIKGNQLTIPSTLNADAGIHISSTLNAAHILDAYVQDNISTTVSPVPGYLFHNGSEEQTLQKVTFENNSGTVEYTD